MRGRAVPSVGVRGSKWAPQFTGPQLRSVLRKLSWILRKPKAPSQTPQSLHKAGSNLTPLSLRRQSRMSSQKLRNAALASIAVVIIILLTAVCLGGAALLPRRRRRRRRRLTITKADAQDL